MPMSRVVLYIAASVDGFIADAQGGVGWLEAMHAGGEDYGYLEFLDSVDAVLLGRRTYDQVLTFGDYPYQDKQSYIFTHRPPAGAIPNRHFVSDVSADWLAEIKRRSRKNLWLVGGADLIRRFWQRRWIDEIILSIVPVVLGAGIPLFVPPVDRGALRLEGCRTYPSGLVQVRYATAEKA